MEGKIIKAGPESMGVYLRKVWQHRRLVSVLAKREIKGQFAQTLLGWGWMLLRPAATLLIFTLLFGELLHLDTGEVPYLVFAFSGMLIWYLFSGVVQSAGTATFQNADLIRKTYFPKIILPISRLAGQLFEFVLHLLLLFILLLVLGITPKLSWFFAPLFLIPSIFLGLGLGLWLSVLTLRRRDLQHLVPYLTNFAIWLTPVFYPVTIIPEAYRDWMYYLNPVASAIEGLRWSVLDTPMSFFPFFIGLTVSIFILITGVAAFGRQEPQIADLV